MNEFVFPKRVKREASCFHSYYQLLGEVSLCTRPDIISISHTIATPSRTVLQRRLQSDPSEHATRAVITHCRGAHPILVRTSMNPGCRN